MYDPEAGGWEIMAAMSSPRSGLAAVLLHDRIYILGGFDGETRLRTVECFTPGATRVVWHTGVPDMITPRSNFAVSVINDKIVVSGESQDFLVLLFKIYIF